MHRRKLIIALFGNCYQAKKSASIQEVLSCLKKYGAQVHVDREYFEFLQHTAGVQPSFAHVFDRYEEPYDYAISMGGDGTLLRTASMVGSACTPIIGVNMGRLGFLADIRPDEFEQCIIDILDGHVQTDQRSLIQVETEGQALQGYNCALNDVAILKRDNASMISIKATVNGEYLTTYQADGLVVSTPTGSTAYSLSNGGPIIIPQTHVFSMTAVAPHSLNTRPLVIPETSTLQIQVESRTHNYLVAIDGRSESMSEDTRLTLSLAPYKAHIVKRKRQNHFQTLREKMMWGADMRDV
ncbi:MAG: NAD kinase [Prevotella sp.]|jgi:NAD+ kinase|nr:NAD kinase [Prevotella sp.]